MPDVHMKKLEARYTLRAAHREAADRLDRILGEHVVEALGHAVERAGIGDSEEICIRHIHVPVRFRLGQTDAGIGAEWSLAFADAIRRAADSASPGPSEDVVRYRSRAQALVDIAVSVARGDTSRAWAWRMLQLWRGNHAPSARDAAALLVDALRSEAHFIAAVIATVARAGLLHRLLASLQPDQCVQLAEACVDDRVRGDKAAEQFVWAIEREEVTHWFERTWLTEAADSIPGAWNDEQLRHAAAALSVLASVEADPAMRLSAVPRYRARIRAMAAMLVEQVRQRRSNLARPLAPESVRSKGAYPAKKAERERPKRTLEEESNRSASREGDAHPFTRYGGLLYLLNVMVELELFRELAEMPVFERRSMRWVSHALALHLLPMPADDPAALAFAGLLPADPPPSVDEDPPNEGESAALAKTAGRLLERTRDWLELRDFEPIALLNWICEKPAQISGDAGWIEVRFSLDVVSTVIRRAGLDRDPGYLPGLGVVMRFIYE